VFYTVVAPPPGKRGWGAVRIDALGGLRLSELELGIHGDRFNGSTSRTIYDPYVGARLTLGLTDWLSFKARGDVGGFGIEAWPTVSLAQVRLRGQLARRRPQRLAERPARNAPVQLLATPC